jgi:hypothetical protein
MKKNEIKVKKCDLEKIEDLDFEFKSYSQTIKFLSIASQTARKKLWDYIEKEYNLNTTDFSWKYEDGKIIRLDK